MFNYGVVNCVAGDGDMVGNCVALVLLIFYKDCVVGTDTLVLLRLLYNWVAAVVFAVVFADTTGVFIVALIYKYLLLLMLIYSFMILLVPFAIFLIWFRS